MKLLILICFAVTVCTNAQLQLPSVSPCVICNDHWFILPDNWENMSKYLRAGCNRLDKPIIWPCRNLVDAMNLWDQYPTLYPLLGELHKQACSVYCGGLKG